jgi:hypothetical protein
MRRRPESLKAVVVARDISICFAGDVVGGRSRGLDSVREVATQLSERTSVDELFVMPQERTSHERRSSEFLVATGSDS